MDVIDDAQLLARSRSGDVSAYAQLYERHVGTALHLARQLSDEAEDVVSDAFMRTYTVLREGRGPEIAFRPYLLRAVRNAAIDRHRRLSRVSPGGSLEEAETPLNHQPAPTDPAIDQLEQRLVTRAYSSLPERWQLVLWHMEVEGETPAQIAPLLGISPRAVAQLAVRAREGLRTAWLQEHINSAPPGHEEMVRLLGGHLRGSLGLRSRRALEAHLAACADCRRLRDELKDINTQLRIVLAAALLGLSIAELASYSPAASAALLPAAGAAAAGATGGPATAAGGAATGVVAGSSSAAAATGAGGLLGATMAAATQPLTAGLVALAVATTGAGAYVVTQSRPAEPGSTSDSRTAEVPAPRPGSPVPKSASPSGSASPSPSPSGSVSPSGSASGSASPSSSDGASGGAAPTMNGSPDRSIRSGGATSGSTTPPATTSGSGTGSSSAGPEATGSGGPAPGSAAPPPGPPPLPSSPPPATGAGTGTP